MKEKIDKFIQYFTTITKEECDYIQSILNWDDDTKLAFIIAKRMFEEKDEKTKSALGRHDFPISDRCSLFEEKEDE